MAFNMNYYLDGFRQLLKEFDLDGILIYANDYDDRYLKAVAGTYSVLQTSVLVTRKLLIISEPRYLVANLAKRTKIKIIPAEGENLTAQPFLKIIGKNNKIGVVGNVKYRDINLFSPNKVIELTEEADRIITYKSDEYIHKLNGYASKLAKLMDAVNISQFKKQADVARELTKSILDLGCSLSFPVCVTSGSDLLQNTAMLAQDKIIRPKDVVCIDMGLKNDIYTTDRTRMYFINNQEAESLYQRIKKVHSYIISRVISPEGTFREIINEYKMRLSRYAQIKHVEEEDFGHGIGFALHEQPMLEQTNSKIGKNIVFTIEPTFDTVFGKMRIEDMVAIKSDGSVMNLTV